MPHEGEILKNYAKVQKGGITALEKALDLSRSGLRYYIDRPQIDQEFKEKVAKVYGTNVSDIWGKLTKRPLITADTPSIDFEFEGDIPTADELKEFMSLALAKMERELKEKITAEVKKDIIDGLTKK